MINKSEWIFTIFIKMENIIYRTTKDIKYFKYFNFKLSILLFIFKNDIKY